jgi:hypothetical protein
VLEILGAHGMSDVSCEAVATFAGLSRGRVTQAHKDLQDDGLMDVWKEKSNGSAYFHYKRIMCELDPDGTMSYGVFGRHVVLSGAWGRLTSSAKSIFVAILPGVQRERLTHLAARLDKGLHPKYPEHYAVPASWRDVNGRFSLDCFMGAPWDEEAVKRHAHLLEFISMRRGDDGHIRKASLARWAGIDVTSVGSGIDQLVEQRLALRFPPHPDHPRAIRLFVPPAPIPRKRNREKHNTGIREK